MAYSDEWETDSEEEAEEVFDKIAETRDEINHFTERSQTLVMLNDRLRVLIGTVEMFRDYETSVHVSIYIFRSQSWRAPYSIL